MKITKVCVIPDAHDGPDIPKTRFRWIGKHIKKTKPIIPSKFKIRDMLTNKKLDTIAKQYMSELRSKALIDIRI